MIATLNEIDRVLGDREVVVTRELTKLHEEVRRGNAAELARHYSMTGVRGEITILIRGTGKRSQAGTA